MTRKQPPAAIRLNTEQAVRFAEAMYKTVYGMFKDGETDEITVRNAFNLLVDAINVQQGRKQ